MKSINRHVAQSESAGHRCIVHRGRFVVGPAASELNEGLANLERLIADLNGRDRTMNEAETRFHIIDRIIVECLGWPAHPDELHLEKAQGREYSDYELGKPVTVIWEAKREGKLFEVPKRRTASLVHALSSVMLVFTECKEAIDQVNGYCLARGVEVAVATNGHQIVVFRAEKDLDVKTK
ncbi:hypothetical protein V5F77_11375 [Xanthobacter sp. DSM 24535]|uniref:hypothetical protein n=1 Tax=Roseixanthobacter psychrophilus TaxID=3119917 RepID=UPI003726C121